MTAHNGTRPPLNLATLGFILRETLREWNDDKVPRLGAALAFYSMLSIGPLVLIGMAVASSAFGANADGYIMAEIRRLIGHQGAEAIANILEHSQNKTTGYVATIIGGVTLVISVTGFFAQMQDALNAIWNVEDRKSDVKWFLMKRVLSFVMVLAIGVLLVAAMLVSAALSYLVHRFTGIWAGVLLHGANWVVSFGVVTVLFAGIFKVLPDVHIRWRDTWVGAGITALLFSLGKFLIGLYLAHSALSSAYGAAGSLTVVLIWIYYSAQIFFIGAEFTQVYTRYMGRQIVIKRGRPQPVNVAKDETALKGVKKADVQPADVAVAHKSQAN